MTRLLPLPARLPFESPDSLTKHRSLAYFPMRHVEDVRLRRHGHLPSLRSGQGADGAAQAGVARTSETRARELRSLYHRRFGMRGWTIFPAPSRALSRAGV